MFGLGRFIIVCGHYGCGKTNLSVNLALDLAKKGERVTLVDLDIVNPYFRSSDYTELLQSSGIEVIAPSFAGTTVDIPSLPSQIYSVFSMPDRTVILDVGGDDVGATALGRFSNETKKLQKYDMLYVVNQYRVLSQTAEEAEGLLKEIEHASRLQATGIVNNSHLQQLTTAQDVAVSVPFAEEIAQNLNLPVVFTAVKKELAQAAADSIQNIYPVEIFVRPPWDTGAFK